MKAKEKNELYKYAAALNDEQLKKEYYDSMDDCCGSLADKMEDLHYDTIDILERRKYEKFLSERSDFLLCLCNERGLSLFD